jgi:hypothetical protein
MQACKSTECRSNSNSIAAINPIQRSLILENIASVIVTDAYVPNDQTSNGSAKGV